MTDSSSRAFVIEKNFEKSHAVMDILMGHSVRFYEMIKINDCTNSLWGNDGAHDDE